MCKKEIEGFALFFCPFFQGDFIQFQNFQACYLVAIYPTINASFQDPFYAGIGKTFLQACIFYCRVHQLQQYLVIISKTMWTFRFMPSQHFCCYGSPFTILALIALVAIAQITRSPKYRQVSNGHPLITPMWLCNLFTTFATGSTAFGALYCDHQLAALTKARLQYANILIERLANSSQER